MTIEKPMLMTPQRIQLRRTKGWKMPPNTVVCTRGSGRRWGNPFRIGGWFRVNPPGRMVVWWNSGSMVVWWHCVEGYQDATYTKIETAAQAVEMHRLYLKNNPPSEAELSELRGKNLACFCKLGQPCHCDALLELANK